MTSRPRTDADWVAALLAVDPVGLGGVVVRSSAGAPRDAWLGRLLAAMPVDAPVRRVPLHIDDDRLLGGLDLAATLDAGRVVAERGLLAAADGGLLLLAMAERIGAGTAARIAAAQDSGERVAERQGVAMRQPARFGVVAFDEGLDDDEAVPARLAERLAFRVELGPAVDDGQGVPNRAEAAAARAALAGVVLGEEGVEALCATALALGVDSARAPLFALRAARAAAALAGRAVATLDDAALAARLVLAHRATRLPTPDDAADAAGAADAADAAPDAAVAPDGSGAEPLPPPPPDGADSPTDSAPPAPREGADPADDSAVPPTSNGADSLPDPDAPPAARAPDASAEPPADVVLAAALAALPPQLLGALQALPAGSRRSAQSGRAGAMQKGAARGRPAGVRRGLPRGGARLDLLQTLRAAAPWQALRRRETGARAGAPTSLHIRREDFHVRRHAQRSETTTLFVVDASGSSALHRLAEAKGAVELLLADCYVRRDSVALIAFRGRGAELLLPPTRSLARAKRSLAGLPGGGGTPLAAGLDAAATLVEALRRRGTTPFVVLLTDGRGNVARDGTPGRAPALRDALAAAARLRAAGAASLLLDTSPQPHESALRIAEALGARYLPLPHAAAGELSRAVRDATPPAR